MSKLLKLIDRNIEPPGGFYYTDPDTGATIRKGAFLTTLWEIQKHRRANNLPVPANLDDILEDQICRRAPASYVQGKRKEETVSYNEKVTMLKSVWKKVGSMTVDQATAEARANVCRYCPHNKPIGCLSCMGVYRWLRQEFGIPKLRIDDFLHVCDIGSIYNKAQVHLADAVFREMIKPNAAEIFPELCWKRRIIEGVSHATESGSAQAVD